MEGKKKIGKIIATIILILIIASIAVFALSDLLTDLLWFKEVGYTSVFLTEFFTKLKIGIPAFLIFGIASLFILTFFKRCFLKNNKFVIEDQNKKGVRRAILAISIALGLFNAILLVSNLWFEFLTFINAGEFNITDPLFGNDIGFYMFRYDFLEGVANCAIAVIVGFVAATVILYGMLVGLSKPVEEPQYDIPKTAEQAEQEFYTNVAEEGLFGGIRKMLGLPSKKEQERKKSNFRKKIEAILNVASGEMLALGIIFFLLVGFRVYLEQFSVLYDTEGLFYGAGFTEVNITLIACRILMVLSVVAAIMLVIAAKKKKIWMAILIPAIMVGVAFLGSGVKGIVQNVIVDPDELTKERPYMAHNIEYTRLAYDLADVKVKEFVPENDLSKLDVLDNMETFSNIRINDFDPAQKFYESTQSIRSYYTFNDVDVDRYWVNDEYTQVFLSARELDASKTDDSWLIQHLKYTHGYGLTLSRVDKITSSGQPQMLIESIPPVSEIKEIQITRPEIYFGELPAGYVVVNTDEPEFDYPSGESNVICEYEGTGGIPLNFFNRVLFAIREQSLKFLISTNINSDSRILINRGIQERIEKIAPFLVYDDDPYVVTVDGKIYWIADGYTASNKYPYSEPYSKSDSEHTNYIRNSVKIVVDAYNGDVNFYICDEEDPIIATCARIYPELFKPLSQMPESLKSHLQYPNALFNIQAKVYERYHMTDVDVFYQNEDRWDISTETYGQAEKQMTANYFIMKLPGEDSAEFVSTISYSPTGKKNLSGIFMARQDGSHYGELVLYRMPKDRQIYGAAQIEAQVSQDAEISKDFSLWNNAGSTCFRGNMFIIPVEDSIVYVEPIYLFAANGALPEVKRVVAFYNDKLAYAPTLAECLDQIFGKGSGDPLLERYPVIAGHEAADKLREEIESGGSGEDNPGTQPDDPGSDIPSGETDLKKALDELLTKWKELGQDLTTIVDMLNKQNEQQGEQM